LAKIDWINGKPCDQQSFSMADYKTMFYDQLLPEQSIRKFAINPNTKKNKRIIRELMQWGKNSCLIIDNFITNYCNKIPIPYFFR
jgi:hypothetical protein